MAGPSSVQIETQHFVLVVERNPLVQRLQRAFLEDAGYQVEFVTDGRAALDAARSLKFELVVTEILVPGLDGLALCRELKGKPDTAGIRVMIFSQLAAEDRALEAGADVFVQKPLGVERFLAGLRRLGRPREEARR